MEVLYLLIPLALLIVAAAVAAFIWAVNSGQFEDTESPAVRVLMEGDDEPTADDSDPTD